MSDKTDNHLPSLKELQDLLAEINTGDGTIDDAIKATERRLKMLRSLKGATGVKSDPKPRTRKAVTTTA